MLNGASNTVAQKLIPPEDPEQTLAYWKPYIVNPDTDNRVEVAQQVFDELLKTWDGTRIEPVLHVVDTKSGPWAASLLDGTVLLSVSAIDVCKKIGGKKYQHLLAFVLAHELSHQRTDDLWHFKFFRLVGVQQAQIQARLLEGIELDQKKFLKIEKQEVQADQDGLTLMTMVGYDPYTVLEKNSFFKAWVENIWDKPCDMVSEYSATSIAKACKKAGVRAARAKAHLEKIATESSLYQLGVEAFVAGKYSLSRKYFKAYGRLYPGHVVHNSIGMSYLFEVMELNKQIAKHENMRHLDFVYPMLLDLNPVSIVKKRGTLANEEKSKAKRKQREKLIGSAVLVFEKAIKLSPEYRPAYLNLIVSYLLNDNTPMARGILLGKYKKIFGTDIEYEMLTVMVAAINKQKNTGNKFKKLVSIVMSDLSGYHTTQIYSVLKNASIYWQYNGDDNQAENVWKQAAMELKSFGDPLLFKLALAELKSFGSKTVKLNNDLEKIRITIDNDLKSASDIKKSHFFWYQGEKIFVSHNEQGDHFIISEKGKRLSSQMMLDGSVKLAGLKAGDNVLRSYIRFGAPDRRVYLLSGEYIAYDKAGIGLYVKNNIIQSWFVY